MDERRQISHLPHHQPTLMITYILGIHCSILFKVSYIPMCKKCSLRFRNNHVNHTSIYYSVLFFRAGVIFLRKSTHVLVSHGYLQCAINVLNSAQKPQQCLTNLLLYIHTKWWSSIVCIFLKKLHSFEQFLTYTHDFCRASVSVGQC